MRTGMDHLSRFARILLLLTVGAFAPAAADTPPPANKLGGYAGYILRTTTMDAGLAKKKSADKSLQRIFDTMQKHVQPIVDEWNAEGGTYGAEKISIEPHIVFQHKPSGAS